MEEGEQIKRYASETRSTSHIKKGKKKRGAPLLPFSADLYCKCTNLSQRHRKHTCHCAQYPSVEREGKRRGGRREGES